ncbi:MAG: glycosyltransferase family 39 protein [Puniceicoccales bacterium]|jgi:hypothetical protein|nr:glycosyltransferase family 39 protein [Puniceicoccales bacterium]
MTPPATPPAAFAATAANVRNKRAQALRAAGCLLGVLLCGALVFDDAGTLFLETLSRAIPRLGANPWVRARIHFFGAEGVVLFVSLFLLQTRQFTALLTLPAARRRLANVAIAGLLALFAANAVSLAFAGRGFDFDESYTLATTRLPWGEIISLRSGDTHPPLFYFYAKACAVLFGSDVRVLRLCVILPMLATGGVTAAFLRREFSAKAAIFFLLAMNTSALAFDYSVTIRGYSFALLFVTFAALAAYHIIRDEREKPSPLPYAALATCVLGALYSHYYAGAISLVGCGLLGIHILFNDKRKRVPILITGGAIVLCFAPWVPVLAHVSHAASVGYPLPPLDFTSGLAPVVQIFSNENAGGYVRGVSVALIIAFAGALALFLMRRHRCQTDYYAAALFLTPFLFYILLLFHSLFARPLILYRYLFPAYGLVWLFIAIEFAKTRNTRILRAAAAMLAAAVAYALIASHDLHKWKHEAFFENFYGTVANEVGENDIFFAAGETATDSDPHHERLIFSFLFPKNITLYLDKVNHYADGVGDSAHYERVYNANFVKCANLTGADWKRFENTAAWVILYEGDPYHDRFKEVMPPEASGGIALKVSVPHSHAKIYHVTPAARLRPWIEAEIQRSSRILPPH